MIGSSWQVAALSAFQSLSWQLTWQLVDKLGQVDQELGRNVNFPEPKPLGNWLDPVIGVTDDVNDQVTLCELKGLWEPL